MSVWPAGCDRGERQHRFLRVGSLIIVMLIMSLAERKPPRVQDNLKGWWKEMSAYE